MPVGTGAVWQCNSGGGGGIEWIIENNRALVGGHVNGVVHFAIGIVPIRENTRVVTNATDSPASLQPQFHRPVAAGEIEGRHGAIGDPTRAGQIHRLVRPAADAGGEVGRSQQRAIIRAHRIVGRLIVEGVK